MDGVLPTDQREVVDRGVVERVRHDTLLSAEAAWERADHGAVIDKLKHSPQRQYRALHREVLQADRAALPEARSPARTRRAF